MKTLLHVGCGRQGKDALPQLDFEKEWKEIRVDIDPAVEPDIVDDISSLSKIKDGSASIIFSKHNIEHLEAHAVASCLAAFYRVLGNNGFAIIRTPNLEGVCHHILQYGPERPLYKINVYGEERTVMALDMLYGATWEIARGKPFMAHRTAFTKRTLYEKLRQAGFEGIEIRGDERDLELCAFALKETEGNTFWDYVERK